MLQQTDTMWPTKKHIMYAEIRLSDQHWLIRRVIKVLRCCVLCTCSG